MKKEYFVFVRKKSFSYKKHNLFVDNLLEFFFYRRSKPECKISSLKIELCL